MLLAVVHCEVGDVKRLRVNISGSVQRTGKQLAECRRRNRGRRQRVFLQVLPGASIVVVMSEHAGNVSNHDGDGWTQIAA